MNVNDQLAQQIGEIADFMLNDVKAFQFLKSEHQSSYDQASKTYGIGGGNFLQTLGVLSVFYFLVKIHHMALYENEDELKKAKRSKSSFRDYSMKIEKSGNSFARLMKLANLT